MLHITVRHGPLPNGILASLCQQLHLRGQNWRSLKMEVKATSCASGQHSALAGTRGHFRLLCRQCKLNNWGR